MLAALLAILGVALVGTVGVGTIGSLVKNRNRGTNYTEPNVEEPQSTREQPTREINRNREREIEPEEERTKDGPTFNYDDVLSRAMRSRAEERANASGLEESNVIEEPIASQAQGESENIDDIPEMPVEFEQEGITLELFRSEIETARHQMIVDTDKYNSLVEQRVKTMGLDPDTEEHRAVVCEAMKRAWKKEVENKNKKLDSYLNELNDDNVEALAKEVMNYFKENYSVEGFVDKIMDSTYISNVSKRYNIYSSKVKASRIYDFLDKTSYDKVPPKVLASREHVLSVMRSIRGYVIGGKDIDNFERDLDKDIRGVEVEIESVDTFVDLYEKIFSQSERIDNLENFKESAEKLIISTDRALQELAEKIDFKSLANVSNDIEVLKKKLYGIGPNETVFEKMQSLENNLTKVFDTRIRELEKNLDDNHLDFRYLGEQILSIKETLSTQLSENATIAEAFRKSLIELEQIFKGKLEDLSKEISSLSEKVGENNKETNQLLEEKLTEFLESDQGMIMFASNFSKMMKSRNKEVKEIVETAIMDKIKRYLNTKGGKERLDPIIINKFNNIIQNNTEITNTIVNTVIERIRQEQTISTVNSGDDVTINGNVYGVDLEEIFDRIVNVTVNGNVYSNSNKQK